MSICFSANKRKPILLSQIAGGDKKMYETISLVSFILKSLWSYDWWTSTEQIRKLENGQCHFVDVLQLHDKTIAVIIAFYLFAPFNCKK